jgi:hypothetical protein
MTTNANTNANTNMDISNFKLGKKPPRIDPRTFRLSDIVPKFPPPPSADWYQGQTSFGMMLNNVLGDCCCAAIGHAEQVATLNVPAGDGPEVTVPDIVIETVYEQACGYVPDNPSTDRGCAIIDTLNWVRQHGLGHRPDLGHPHRHRLFAYADPDPRDIDHIKQAIATFGIIDLGLQLPVTAQSQVGGVWDVVGNPDSDPASRPGSWGGHCVCVAAYDATTFTCITWGSLQVMTTSFLTTYSDEAHCLLMNAWMERYAPLTPAQLANLEQMLAALNN